MRIPSGAALLSPCDPHHKKISISYTLAGQRVGIKEVDDGIWIVSSVK
jgi:hypothetical protein